MNEESKVSAIEQLRKALGQFQSALNVVDDAIAMYSDGNKLLWCNKSFEDFSGASRINILGLNLQEWMQLVDFEEKTRHTVNEFLINGESDTNSDAPNIFYRKRLDVECTYMIEIHYVAFKQQQKTLVLVIKNITDKYRALNLQKQTQLLEEETIRCSLTGLLNRRGLYKELNSVFSEGMQNYLTVVFCDVDKFKQINDIYGHDVGDQALLRISSILRMTVRNADFVGRLAGDEFIIGVMNSPETSFKIAKKIVERISESLNKRHKFQRDAETIELEISISFGIACGSEADDIDQLVRNADMAMYQAKSNNSGFYYYNSQLRHESEIGDFISETSEQYKHDGLIPYHIQPITSISSNLIVGYEVLVRPISKDGVLIPADKFIKFHEEKGSISVIDQIIIDSVLLNFNQDLLVDGKFISINVSATTLCSERFSHEFIEKISNSCISFNSVVIEITETAYIKNQSLLEHTVENLSLSGIRVFLDDFGAGQTGLIQLVNLPIHGFKIDSTLFNRSKYCKKVSSLLSSFALFAKQMDFAFIIEGIEDELDIQHLLALNVDLAQGYKFSHPMPQEIFSGEAESRLQELSCPTDITIKNPFRKFSEGPKAINQTYDSSTQHGKAKG